MGLSSKPMKKTNEEHSKVGTLIIGHKQAGEYHPTRRFVCLRLLNYLGHASGGCRLSLPVAVQRQRSSLAQESNSRHHLPSTVNSNWQLFPLRCVRKHTSKTQEDSIDVRGRTLAGGFGTSRIGWAHRFLYQTDLMVLWAGRRVVLDVQPFALFMGGGFSET